MFKNKKLLVFIVINLTLEIVVFVLSQPVLDQCEMLLKTQPAIDVFPNSEILETTLSRTGEDYALVPTLLGAAHYSRVVTEYITDADFTNVISFYQQTGKCNDVKEGAVCYGDLQPF